MPFFTIGNLDGQLNIGYFLNYTQESQTARDVEKGTQVGQQSKRLLISALRAMGVTEAESNRYSASPNRDYFGEFGQSAASSEQKDWITARYAHNNSTHNLPLPFFTKNYSGS